MKILASLALLVATTFAALAQDSVDIGEQPEIRRYTVEMIIFSYAENVSVGTEIFPPDLPPAELPMFDDEFSDANEILQSTPEVVATPVEPLENEPRKYELVMLAEEDFELLNTADRLERLDAYDVLLHFGWTQPMYPDEEAEARPLSSFVTPPPGLEGDLLLYLSRYLHLAINLQLDAPTSVAASGSNRRDDRDYRYSYDDAAATYPVHYRIDEDRIFRNGELRYFDHPKFGVLAKITRVEEEDPVDDGVFEDGELLGD